jgi:hypothetical protein
MAGPNGILEPDPNFHRGKKTLLMYLSCHGRAMMYYFKTRADVTSAFNLIRLETGPMLLAMQAGHPVFQNQALMEIFKLADIVVTYNMGPRHGLLGLDNVRPLLRPDSKMITIVAPNCTCFWPICYGYGGGIGVMEAMDRGLSEDQIWSLFLERKFEPYFNLRFRLELGRLQDKESYHDIGLAHFVERNHKKTKLWMAGQHPSYITMAWLGSRVLDKLGMPSEPEEHILKWDHTLGGMGGQPETHYEFEHFKFEYPMRHMDDAGGLPYYRELITSFASHWRHGGFISPPHD